MPKCVTFAVNELGRIRRQKYAAAGLRLSCESVSRGSRMRNGMFWSYLSDGEEKPGWQVDVVVEPRLGLLRVFEDLSGLMGPKRNCPAGYKHG